jgi:Orsellinic acid/F9775 biosynthesis cluster protein D
MSSQSGTQSIRGHRYHPFQQVQATSQHVSESTSQALDKSELRSSPLLDYLGYRFHVEHLVVICVACGSALLPSHALGHVKNQHNIPVSKDQQELWTQNVLDWNMTTSNSISSPRNRRPVELLKLHPDAYCCNICEYAALTSATFSKHWSNKHRTHDMSPSDRYHRGCVQTFYSHAPCTYFEVDIPIPSSSSLFDVYMKKEVPTYASFDVVIPSAPREIPPLLYTTRWHEHLADYLPNKPRHQSLMTLAHPRNYTKCNLWKLVWNYLATVAIVAKESSMRVRCLLTEYPR